MQASVEFFKNLSRVLAHSAVFFSEDNYPRGFSMGGDPPAPLPQESTAQIIASTVAGLPSLSEAVRNQIVPNELANLQAAQLTTPQYAQILQQAYDTYGPSLTQSGQKLEALDRLGRAQTDVDILKGPGKDLTLEAQNISRMLDPEFYSTRAATGTALDKALGSLSNSDAEAERLVNAQQQASGQASLPASASKTLSGALQFGDEKLKRISALTNAVNAASSFLPASKSDFNPVQTSLNRPSSGNQVTSQFGVQQPNAGQAQGLAQSILGQSGAVTQQAADINANRRSGYEKTLQNLPDY